jgi:hypothetical protein
VRKAAGLLAVLALIYAALAGSASAAPTVTLKAGFVPIAGFPHTGNILGDGAVLQLDLTIKGTEYGGYPPPLIGASVLLPAGASIRGAGFTSCPTQTIVEEHASERCPLGSHAGPVGSASGFVVFGSERVPETFSIEPFYTPAEAIDLHMAGITPAAIGVTATGRLLDAPASGQQGPELLFQVPLVETVPGAPDASLELLDLKLGSGRKDGARWTFYMQVPSQCPSGGFQIGAQLTFAGLGGLTQQTVNASSAAPCPTGAVSVAPEEGPPAPQAPIPGTGGAITAPSNAVCTSRRDFTIHVIQIKHVVYRKVSIYLNGRRINVVRGARITAPVDLRGLPKGRYTLRITVTTSTGKRITGTRTYHTCAAKPLHPRAKPRL